MIDNNLVRIRPCTAVDLELLTKCASADGHGVIAPSFLVEKGHQLVGYLGIVPTVTLWMDTQRTNIRDSLMTLNFFENHLRCSGGAQVVGVACQASSPYVKVLPRVGYVDMQTNVFMKNINQ